MKYWNFSLTLVFFISLAIAAPAQIDDATRQLSHDIFKQLIEINTTDSVGNVTTAAKAMAQRFRDAGFPESDMQILGPNDRKKNLVVRLHGSGKHKPVLLIGHLDVVEARREDWTTDPFQFVEKDGYYYGRGTQDMKDGDAIMSTTLIRFKKEGFVPDRDIILALTADEEGGTSNGVDWLIKNHRELIDAEFVLNHDGGGILSEQGKPQFMPPALPSAAPASLTTWISPGPAPVRARSRVSPAITPPGNRRIARGAAARALVRGHSMISRRTQSTGQDQDGLRAAPVPANAVARFLEAAPFSFAPAGLGL